MWKGGRETKESLTDVSLSLEAELGYTVGEILKET